MTMTNIITMSFTTLIIQILMICKEMIIFCPESPQEIFLKEWSQKLKTLFQESTTCVFRNLIFESPEADQTLITGKI